MPPACVGVQCRTAAEQGCTAYHPSVNEYQSRGWLAAYRLLTGTAWLGPGHRRACLWRVPPRRHVNHAATPWQPSSTLPAPSAPPPQHTHTHTETVLPSFKLAHAALSGSQALRLVVVLRLHKRRPPPLGSCPPSLHVQLLPSWCVHSRQHYRFWVRKLICTQALQCATPVHRPRPKVQVRLRGALNRQPSCGLWVQLLQGCLLLAASPPPSRAKVGHPEYCARGDGRPTLGMAGDSVRLLGLGHECWVAASHAAA
jgi:hypothetical protein